MRAECKPVFLPRGDRPIFMWHHVPAAGHRRNAAVVLCPPLGFEYMSVYATWKTLGERLASAGFDVLRIDYDGTGDSAGDHNDTGRLCAWRSSVDAAIDAARRLAGASSVTLFGLRAGAMIALDAAAERGDVDRIVLWCPFASGRAYLRELRAQTALAREAYAADEPSAPGMNVCGYILTQETIDALEQWRLDRLEPGPIGDVLLLDRAERPLAAKIDAQLTRLGARVTKLTVEGTEDMLQLPHDAKIPMGAVNAVVDWLAAKPTDPSTIVRPSPEPAGSDTWCGQGFREHAVRFGPDGRLFGILTSPEHLRSDAPALILPNTGAEYHIGQHRMYVPLAREHAARGHLVLRFDLGGLGDSEPPAGQPCNQIFPDHMMDDLREAIALVRRDAPRRPIVVAGLCTGGWLAFDAARQGVAIDGFVAINPPLFVRDGAKGMEWVSQFAEVERYKQSASNPAKWIRTLGKPRVCMTVMRAVAKTARRRAAAAFACMRRTPAPDSLAADLSVIAERGINGQLVFSRGDEGLAYVQQQAWGALLRKNIRQSVSCTVVEGAGHTFRPRAGQAKICELIDETVAAISVGRPRSEDRRPLRIPFAERAVVAFKKYRGARLRAPAC